MNPKEPKERKKSLLDLWRPLALFIMAYVLLTSLPMSRHKTTDLDLGPVENTSAPDLRHPAPNTAFKEASGQTVQISDLKGKPAIVRFWAPWCGVCLKESKPFARMAGQLPESVAAVVVAVDYSSQEEVFRSLGQSHSYKLWFDPSGEAMQHWGVDALPSSFLLDASGVVRRKIIGGTDWLNSSVPADLERLTELNQKN